MCKYTDNEMVAAVSVDKIQSDQSGLVPQLSGKLTSSCIWSSQAIMDHFSALAYVELMRSTSQEKYDHKNYPLKDCQLHLGLKFLDIMQTMGYLMNNCSDQQSRIPTEK